ncbi:MAG: class A beta-lactamase [Bdellovibrionales bacterium]
MRSAAFLIFAFAPLVILPKTAMGAESFAQFEKKADVKIGVFARRGDKSISYSADRRFPHCSTFKWVLCAAILKQAEERKVRLDQKVPFGEKDIVSHSPILSNHLKAGKMSVRQLCAAAIRVSDNGAANLLFPLVGGPSGLQRFVRTLGDSITRFDRLEPELNHPGDEEHQDSTTPKAMTDLIAKLLGGHELKFDSKALLKGWLTTATTGNGRLKAAVPADWEVGHKTGMGDGFVHDVGYLQPPRGKPVYISIFTEGTNKDLAVRDKVIADVAKIALAELGLKN